MGRGHLTQYMYIRNVLMVCVCACIKVCVLVVTFEDQHRR